MKNDGDEEKTDAKEEDAETKSGDGTVEGDPLGPNCYYNKAKCFFDNISSEMKSRYGPIHLVKLTPLCAKMRSLSNKIL